MTATWGGLLSIQGCAARFCRLDAFGNPISSATGMWANSAYTKLNMVSEKEDGDKFLMKTACGAVFINYRDQDQVKWLNLTFEVMYPDPALMELILGGELLVTDSTEMGFAYPKLANGTGLPNPVSCEVWAKAMKGNIQSQDGDDAQWYRYLLPLTYWTYDGVDVEDKPETLTVTGYAMENPNFGSGPFSDWTFDSTRVLAWALDTNIPAVLEPGYQTTVVS